MKTLSARILAAALVIALFLPGGALASIPDGYYDKASGLAKERLKTALHDIIAPHRRVSSYQNLPSYFKKTDVRPGTDFWWDMYSDMDVPVNITFGTYMNREHSFPKSWWGGSTTVAAYTDLFHLYPAEAAANQAKSNWPLGMVRGKPSFDNDVVKVGAGVESGGADKVFEPADEYKGDFARTYFYFVTAYQDLQWKYKYMVTDGAYPTLQSWAIEMLLEWHRDDPVSEKELRRNEAVYAIQTNRNPFIDYPELAEYIWGDKMGQTFVPDAGSGPSGEPELSSPAAGDAVEFGDVALGHSGEYALLFKGSGLTGELELSVIGADRDLFTLSSATVGGEAVSSPSGVYVTVGYTPTAVGLHEASLIVQDGGLDGSISVPLRGRCVPEPQLLAPHALPAEVLAPGRFEARWEQPEGGDPVDFWNLYLYRDGSAEPEVIMAEQSPLEIDLGDGCLSASYQVTACALGCESAPSNMVTVDATGSSWLPEGGAAPLAVTVSGLELTIVCSESHTGLRVIDPTGRIVVSRRAVTGGDKVVLPGPGVYIIVTDRHLHPIRIIAR